MADRWDSPCGRVTLYRGDCLEVLPTLDADSVDSIVTDPPYGLSFMGKRWDYDVPSEDVWRECLRVLKPGGHLLAFAGTRTQHRMAVRIEDAGFEIRDMIAWVYGSGFPKSHNLKDEWAGFGTALKPALEPITVARKPFPGTVAANVLAHGTGAINVDGCRVGTESTRRTSNAGTNGDGWRMGTSANVNGSDQGRWPANLIHDGSDEVVGLFPVTKSGALNAGHKQGAGSFGKIGGETILRDYGNDSGSAARFFYCAKCSKADRNEGCRGMERRLWPEGGGVRSVEAGQSGGFGSPRENHHPTVKPTDLMRYLCRLVTPPDGVVLDPFMGSGSTGKAAMLEGFRFVGIEIDERYYAIAKRRITEALAEDLFAEQKITETQTTLALGTAP